LGKIVKIDKISKFFYEETGGRSQEVPMLGSWHIGISASMP
jgi:hypothetical protein